MDLYALFETIEQTPVGAAIRESLWLFPAIEAVHLLALAILGGAVLMMDFRLLGVGVSASAPTVLRNLRPWMLGALATMLATGVLLAVSEMVKLYDKPAYWLKMAALAAVLIFTFAVKHPMIRRGVEEAPARTLAAVSIALWLTVAVSGRWIGFS